MTRQAQRDGYEAEHLTDIDRWAAAEWGPPDALSDGGQQGLRALLQRRLAHKVSSGNETFAQHVVQKLISDALRGNLRAVQEIFALVDGHGAARESRAESTPTIGVIDERMASRILEATHDDRDDPPGD